MSDKFKIKDIGSAREKWLNQHGIHTYADLANANAAQIHEQLKTEGKIPVPVETIQNWIEEASLMATTQTASEPAITEPDQAQNCIPIPDEGWDEFASFYISYQKHPTLRTQVVYRTCADHMEANENQQWDGIQGTELCDWIMKHVDTIMNDSQSETATSMPLAHSTKPNEIRIVSVQVHDAIGGVANAVAGGLFKGAVHSQQPLTFDFTLEYLTTDSEDTKGDDDAWDYKLTLYVNEMPSDTLVLKPQKISQRLSESGQNPTATMVTQLPAGLYRIRAVATLTSQMPVLSVIDIPLLQII